MRRLLGIAMEGRYHEVVVGFVMTVVNKLDTTSSALSHSRGVL